MSPLNLHPDQTLLISHHKTPVNWEAPTHFVVSAEGSNPLCGDHVRFYLVDSGKIWFTGESCLYGKAMASLICSTLEGTSWEKAQKACDDFILWLKGHSDDNHLFPQEWQCFRELRDFPVRQKCVLTPITVFKNLLVNQSTAKVIQTDKNEGNHASI